MKNHKLTTLILLGLFVFSCQKQDDEFSQSSENLNTNGMLQLGAQLENPYAVSTMKKAYENLKKTNLIAKSSFNDIEITPTHLYIKFKPKNEAELDILKVDSTLVLYDYPLDYSIAENGSYYKDPETAPEQPTYQYCAVTIDKKLPNGVEYEVLEELFIPDEDKDTITTTAKANTKFISEEIIYTLVNEALRITNNLNNKTPKSTNLAKSSASKWRPAGTIKVWDDVVGDFVPVEGVKVRARRWFTTHTGIASASGRYSCNGRFRRDANYSIDWERYEFALQDGWLNGATYNGPKKRGDWNLNLNSGKQEYYATIFSAAHFYYYGSRMGLKSPPTNATFKTKMKIAARLERDVSSHIHQRRFILSAPIYIKTYGRESQAVFGTTIHELAHAAHWNLDRDAYNNLGAGGYVLQKHGDKRTLETWATTVEIVLTNDWYKRKLGLSKFEHYFKNRQDYPISAQPFYTSVGFDLIDDFNQRHEIIKPSYSGAYPQDRVSGYTIKQIENSMKNTISWDIWKENLKKQNPNNPTNKYLDELFNNW